MYENERRESEAIIRNGWALIVVPLVLGVGGGCVLCPVLGLPWVATAWLALCVVFSAFMAWFFRNPRRVEHRLGRVGEKRPGIVHRLDMDTSGVMVVAKNDRAYQALANAFAAHDLRKTYVAIVHGIPPLTGTLDTNIGHSPANRQKMAILRFGGKRAITHWNVLATLPGGLARVECDIETGRTHQIRVHLASLGTPIVGDALYGKPALDRRLPYPPARQLLHARRLCLNHPITGHPLDLQAPFPKDFSPYL